MDLKILMAGENISEGFRDYILKRIGKEGRAEHTCLIYGTADAGIMGHETLATIKRIHDTTGQIIDPHTAVAAAARLANLNFEEGGPKVVLSTAHPAKFPAAVAKAIGIEPPVPAALAALDKLPEKLDILPNSLSLLRQFISSRLTE